MTDIQSIETVSPYPLLASPLTIRGKTFPNRIQQVATATRGLIKDGRVSEKQIAFYDARARNGVGSVVMTLLGAHPSVDGGGRVAAHNPANIDGFAWIANAMHEHGTLIFGQLTLHGSSHHTDHVPTMEAPSAIACPHGGGVPHTLDVDEIEEFIRYFALSAKNLQEAGIDGVELHAGQGHLLQEFLSPFSNKRTDKYGGDFSGRLAFVTEILSSCRDACGPDFLIMLRLGVEEFTVGGLSIDVSMAIATELAAQGNVDIFSVTQANFNSLEMHTPDRWMPIAPFVNLAAAIKDCVGNTAVVACGRIIEPNVAEDVLESGAGDIIGLCRPLLADHEWAKKALGGEADRIRTCISCNQCWGGASATIHCIQNPITGRELAWIDPPHRAPGESVKTIVVVGGGPAGMEAARVSAEYGSRVVLFEREDELGGLNVLAGRFEPEVGWVSTFLIGAVHNAGVDVRLRVTATSNDILAEKPDAVIIATGSNESRDSDFGDVDIPVYVAADIADTYVTGKIGIVLDDDGYYEALAVARHLALQGKKIYLLTRFYEVGREVVMTSRTSALRELDNLGVVLLPTTWVVGAKAGTTTLENYLSKRLWTLNDVDFVVRVGQRVAENGLYYELLGRVDALRLIGDAYQPRRIKDAVIDGHAAAREFATSVISPSIRPERRAGAMSH